MAHSEEVIKESFTNGPIDDKEEAGWSNQQGQ